MRQVNELLRITLAELVQRDVDLSPGSFVTITRVETSRDLKHAAVFVTILPDGKRASTMNELVAARSQVQRDLGKRISMKFTPKIHFEYDQGGIKAQGIFKALDSLDSEEEE